MAEAVGQPGAHLTWSGRAVDVGRIESELVRLRYEAAGPPADGEPFAIRTSLLNLVVYAASEKAARQASRVIASLPSHHPSRTLITVAKPSGGESRVDAQLAAHCHISPGLEHQVCCEEVMLEVKGGAAEHLHSIILPLLVADLPLYVWWPGELPGDPHMLQEMLVSADRLIVDSGRFSRAEEGLARLAQVSIERPQCAVGDLNWGRLTPWRQLVAQQCETAGLRLCLKSATKVEIGLAGGGREQRSQALLLLGWLAWRFGWETERVSGRGPEGFTLDSSGGAVSVKVAAADGGAGREAGWIASLSLEGASDGGAGSLRISRGDDPRHLAVRAEELGKVLEGRVLIEACDEGEMLARELRTVGHEAEYEEALRRALAILGPTV